jgi:serine/threonine protein kinase
VRIARFRREAEAAAQLRSAHTVDLYDFGVTEDQTLYLVMEFLDGMESRVTGSTARPDAGAACGSCPSSGL